MLRWKSGYVKVPDGVRGHRLVALSPAAPAPAGSRDRSHSPGGAGRDGCRSGRVTDPRPERPGRRARPGRVRLSRGGHNRDVPCFICVACGVQHAESPEPPASCAICEDERQYVPLEGQRWTTLEELRADHRNELRDDAGLTGIGTEPCFAIGQRALLVPAGGTNVLWDCMPLLDDETVARGRAARRPAGDRDLAPALLLDARRVEPRVRRRPGLRPRRRPRVGAAPRPVRRAVGGRDARPRRRADADPLRRALRRRPGPALRRGRCSRATSSRSSRTAPT